MGVACGGQKTLQQIFVRNFCLDMMCAISAFIECLFIVVQIVKYCVGEGCYEPHRGEIINEIIGSV